MQFRQFAGREIEHHKDRFRPICVQPRAIHLQEQAGGDECGTLIAVDEGMVLNDPERVGGSQPARVIYLLIGEEILGASQC